MAGQAVRGFQHCHKTVALVAFNTPRDAPVFFRMAGGAFLLRMPAHFSLQAGCNLDIAQAAAAFKGCRPWYGNQQLVGVGMGHSRQCISFS
jgi:hypothetical protein